MYRLNEETVERIYAGWLGKIIGIRLGAPIEGWTYDKIRETYGEVNDYLVDYQDFAADDDSNGPVFFIRSLGDSGKKMELQSQDVAEALLNYASYEHGFFWWGGYGVSTEHTAYLNLRAGVSAPDCGSIATNGAVIAEQIGGQIFIDSWGLVSPGNPEQAVKLAGEAASVTHGGNGVYGGQFIAACISLAFLDLSMKEMLEQALTWIPEDCEYARVVKAVMCFYQDNPNNWRDCYEYLRNNFGYDRYPGNCHIIPNAGVIILGLLYGKDDYSDTINICNMCGWDTDCNVGNVGAIMGVRKGIEGIPYEKWRRPINDLLLCSSVVGSLNIMDIPYGATYMAKQAFDLAEQEIPERWKEIVNNEKQTIHFEYPGSTHAMRVRCESHGEAQHLEYQIQNTKEESYTGKRSLKLYAKPLKPAQIIYLYQKTYYQKEDLHDNRYDPCFSPLIYPGQTVSGCFLIRKEEKACLAQLYVKDLHSGVLHYGPRVLCQPGKWEKLVFKIPELDGALLEEVGFAFTMLGDSMDPIEFCAYIDELQYGEDPMYSIDYAKEKQEMWTVMHHEITQFTKLKGWTWLEGGRLHITGSDFAETYTGSHLFKNYGVETTLYPISGMHHRVNFRVQGAMRSYAVGLEDNNTLVLWKNQCGYQQLVSIPYPWKNGCEYPLNIYVDGSNIIVADSDKELIKYQDADHPYLEGAIGFSVQKGSHCSYGFTSIKNIKSYNKKL